MADANVNPEAPEKIDTPEDESKNTVENEKTADDLPFSMEDEKMADVNPGTPEKTNTPEDKMKIVWEEEKMGEQHGVHSKQSLNELSCVVCTDVYKQPQLLHCMHTFCSHCIQQSICHQGSVLIMAFISSVFNFNFCHTNEPYSC